MNLSPIVPPGIVYGSKSFINENSHQITEKTNIVNGPASGTVTLTVTTLVGSNGSTAYFYVNGVGIMALGQSFTLPLDASGNANFTTITDAGARPPINGINAILTITAVSSGVIGPYSTIGFSHTN